jgi:hypothetical protein
MQVNLSNLAERLRGIAAQMRAGAETDIQFNLSMTLEEAEALAGLLEWASRTMCQIDGLEGKGDAT